METFKELSRKGWGPKPDGRQPTNEEVAIGLQQRMADSLESIAAGMDKATANVVQLQNEAQRYKDWYHQEREKSAKLDRTISALRGQITRLKNKMAQNQPSSGTPAPAE